MSLTTLLVTILVLDTLRNIGVETCLLSMFPCLPHSGNIVAETKSSSYKAKVFSNKLKSIWVVQIIGNCIEPGLLCIIWLYYNITDESWCNRYTLSVNERLHLHAYMQKGCTYSHSLFPVADKDHLYNKPVSHQRIENLPFWHLWMIAL